MRQLTLEEQAINSQTWEHIYEIQKLLTKVRNNFDRRALVHDQSKLRDPEVELFTKMTPKLKTMEFGSEEYKQSLLELKPALDNHYKCNRHHPEHFTNGINDMSLFDVMEMLVDWLASTKCTLNGDIQKSITLQQSRFGISDQLSQIMRNTIKELQ